MSCYLSMHLSFFCADINQNRALIKAVDTFAYRLCFQALLPLEKKIVTDDSYEANSIHSSPSP